MKKGVRIRLAVFDILMNVYMASKTMESHVIKKIIANYKNTDVAFINNVCLFTMRYSYHLDQIINIYVKKKPNSFYISTSFSSA